MGSVGRVQSGLASINAREVASQNSMRPGWKGEGGTPSVDVWLLAVVKGWCSHLGRPLKTSHANIKNRIGSTIVLLLRMLIMLSENWNVHDGSADGW